jgi:ketosteroid isomerase-like protein
VTSAKITDALARWHQVVADRDARGLDALLADDVVFHSPVVHTPQRGKAITKHYLTAALHVFGNDSFRYVRELSGGNDAVLEFQVEIDGIQVNGVDMIRCDDDGRIVDFKVMIRPLKAVHLIHQQMATLLEERRP